MDGARATRSRIPRLKSSPVQADPQTLNFKVTSQFKREFKGYAVSQGVSMVDLLKEGFELTKRKRAHQ